MAVLALVPAALLVAVLAFEALALVAAGATASGAADLAAVAAAGALVPGGDHGAPEPRRAAEQVAVANGGALVSCSCDGIPVVVVVAVDAPSPFGLVRDRLVTRTARATLVPDPGPVR